MIEKLYKICEALEQRFPGNRDPFRTLARLMEAHLAQSVDESYQKAVSEGLTTALEDHASQ